MNRSEYARAARRRLARPVSETGIGAGAIRPAEAAQVNVNPAVLGDVDVRVDLAVRLRALVRCVGMFRILLPKLAGGSNTGGM